MGTNSKHGNTAAAEFEALVTPHFDAMLRTARRLVADANDAEDLVQEAVLRGYRFFGRFERDTNFKAWIFKILMNTFVNHYRRRKRQEVSYDLESGEGPEAVADEVDPLDDAETLAERERILLDQVDERIKQAVEELPEHLRAVFMLAGVEGFKYREIAKILDCPVGTVMSRLFRGRAMLKQRLLVVAEEDGFSVMEEAE